MDTASGELALLSTGAWICKALIKKGDGVNLFFKNQTVNEELKYFIRFGKIILIIIAAIIGLALFLAYNMSVFLGVPGFKN